MTIIFHFNSKLRI